MPEPTRTVDPATASQADPVSTVVTDAATSAVPPPSVRYVLGEEIARGGIGEVYRATDAVLGREVAVKVLQPKYHPESSTARRFHDEARIAAQLQHPGIPAVHDLGTLPDGRPFLAMKLIRGDTLDELLKRRPTPAADRGRFVAIFEQICHALAYAHAHGVIHRDLKPANVMVGNFGEVQVMDWGLAKVLASGGRQPPGADSDPDATADPDPTEIKFSRDSDDLRTQAGSILGTPAFMAPEQAIGAVDKMDRRTDVFGLGALLAVLLTGKPPFVSESSESTRQLAAMGKVTDCFARLGASASEPDLVALCKRCLSPEPENRPANAEEVATAVAALRAAAADRARQAEIDREKAEVESREQRKRRRVVQWAGGLTAAVLALGVVGTTVGLLRAEDQRIEAEHARGREQERADGEKEAKEEAVREKARAEQAEADTLADYRAATDDAIQQLIGSKPELGPHERAYLETTLKRWQAFADRKGDDERSRAIRAEGHYRVATLWHMLGHLDRARAGFEAARDSWRALADAHPAVADYQKELAGTHNNLGRLFRDLGRREEARAEYVAARTLFKRLADTHPAVPKYRQGLAGIHTNLGILCRDLGRREEAQAEHETARDLRKGLVATFPTAPDYRQELAGTHTNLGNLFRDRGRWPEARQEYETARDQRKALAAAHPAVRAYQSLLANSHANLAHLLTDMGRGDDARKEYAAALTLQRKLAGEYPAVPEYRHELADTHNSLGFLLYQLDRREEALEEYGTARDLQKALADFYPAVPAYRVELAKTHTNLGILFHATGHRAEASKEFGTARRLREALADAHPAVSKHRVELGGSYINFGNLARDDGRTEDSLEWYQKAVGTLRPIVEAEPQYFMARQFLRNGHVGRARASDRLGRFAEADKDWDRAVELSPPPEQPRYRASRATSRLNAGLVAEAVAEVAELRKLPGWNAGQLYDFACVYAVASDKIDGKKTECADAAVELLSKGVKAGYKDHAHMKKDADLDPLRDRDDFKKLVAELEAKFPAKREVLPPPRVEK